MLFTGRIYSCPYFEQFAIRLPRARYTNRWPGFAIVTYVPGTYSLPLTLDLAIPG